MAATDAYGRTAQQWACEADRRGAVEQLERARAQALHCVPLKQAAALTTQASQWLAKGARLLEEAGERESR